MLEWQPFRDEGHPSVQAVGAWLGSMSQLDREAAVGDILALRALAANGAIVEGEDEGYASLKPIRRDPDLFELRWYMFGKHVRQYHAEPPEMPIKLIDLHLHLKTIVPRDDAATRSAQDEEISWAQMRYFGGKSRQWLL